MKYCHKANKAVVHTIRRIRTLFPECRAVGVFCLRESLSILVKYIESDVNIEFGKLTELNSNK